MSRSDDLSVSTEPPVRTDPSLLRVIDRVTCGFGYLAALGVICLILNVFVDVVGRKFFSAPWPGTIERTTYWWMPTLVLLGYAYAEYAQEHIKVTILLDALPERMRQIVEGVFGLLATLLLIALVYYTYQDAMKSFNFREITSSKPPVEIWPARFLAVIGIALLALQSGASTLRRFMGLPVRPGQLDNEADVV